MIIIIVVVVIRIYYHYHCTGFNPLVYKTFPANRMDSHGPSVRIQHLHPFTRCQICESLETLECQGLSKVWDPFSPGYTIVCIATWNMYVEASTIMLWFFFEHADEVVNLLCVVCSVPSFTETTGQFRTAGAKEYPPGFCAALVHTLLGGLAARHCRESLRVVQWSQLGKRDRDWITAVELASSRCISSHFLPDYQPHWSALLHVSTERLSISCRMKNEFKAHPEFWEEHCKLSNLPPLHRFPHNVYIEPWSCW